jgi:hypothetical protein
VADLSGFLDTSGKNMDIDTKLQKEQSEPSLQIP